MPHLSREPLSGLCPKLHATSGMGTVPLWGVETPESGQPCANPCGDPRTKRRRPCPEGADSPHTHTHIHTHSHSHTHTHTHIHTHTHTLHSHTHSHAHVHTLTHTHFHMPITLTHSYTHTLTTLTLSQVELPGTEDHIFIHGRPEGPGNREE